MSTSAEQPLPSTGNAWLPAAKLALQRLEKCIEHAEDREQTQSGQPNCAQEYADMIALCDAANVADIACQIATQDYIACQSGGSGP